MNILFFSVPSVTSREKNKPEKKLARKKLSVCNSAFKELTFWTSEAFLLAEKMYRLSLHGQFPIVVNFFAASPLPRQNFHSADYLHEFVKNKDGF